ncbi:hypothetical protein BH24DEI2_BH24DEI2_06660 [soil metagenome]
MPILCKPTLLSRVDVKRVYFLGDHFNAVSVTRVWPNLHALPGGSAELSYPAIVSGYHIRHSKKLL